MRNQLEELYDSGERLTVDARAWPSGEPKSVPIKNELKDPDYEFDEDFEEPEGQYAGAEWPTGGLNTDYSSTTSTALDRNVCILSLTSHYYDAYPMRRQGSYNQFKRLRLCEAITLFHTTEATGDVAAVSLVLSPDEIKFLVAKNRTCTVAEWASTQELLRALKSANSKRGLASDLFNLFYRNCKAEFQRRMDTARAALTKNTRFSITKKVLDTMHQRIPGRVFSEDSAAEFITKLIWHIKETEVTSAEDFANAISLCCTLASILQSTPGESKLLRTLNEVAEYDLAISRIAFWTFHPRYAAKRSQIKFEEVSIPPYY